MNGEPTPISDGETLAIDPDVERRRLNRIIRQGQVRRQLRRDAADISETGQHPAEDAIS